MGTERWPRWAFLACAGIHVVGLFLDRRLLPYAGTLTLAALLAMALAAPVRTGDRRWPGRAVTGGLAVLAVLAGIVDARTGGYGWPAEFTRQDGPSVFVEAGLLTVAAMMLATAALGMVTWRRRRVWLLPLGAYAVLTVSTGVAGWLHVSRPPGSSGAPADPAALATVLALPYAAALLLAVAVFMTWASPRGLRRVGVGLLPLLVMGIGAMPAVATQEALRPEVRPTPCDATSSVWDEPVCPDGGSVDHQRLIDPVPRLSDLMHEPYVYRSEIAVHTVEDLPPGWVPTDLTQWAGAAAEPAPVLDIAAVPAGPSWSGDVWAAPADWRRSQPALTAALLLLGLIALTTSLLTHRRNPPLDR